LLVSRSPRPRSRPVAAEGEVGAAVAPEPELAAPEPELAEPELAAVEPELAAVRAAPGAERFTG
jgi:hypothetical protein